MAGQQVHQKQPHQVRQLFCQAFRQRTTLSQSGFQSGFSLPELLIVIVLVGSLAAGVVHLQKFASARKLTAAQDELLQSARQAQAQALRTHSTWRISVREPDSVVQWAVHPANTLPSETDWQEMPSEIHLDHAGSTLPRSNGTYRIEFDYRGHVPPPFGRLTLSIENGGNLKRCIFVSTLLGTIRRANDQACR